MNRTPAEPTFVPPPPNPAESFMRRVYEFWDRVVDWKSCQQETQWFDVDTIEVARGIKTTKQPVLTDDLEKTEAANARLINGPYIARDKNNVPILGYFPGALSNMAVDKTHEALSTYINELSTERATRAEKRAKKEAEKHTAKIPQTEHQNSQTSRDRKVSLKVLNDDSSPKALSTNEKAKWS
jgi:hypothetical protein